VLLTLDRTGLPRDALVLEVAEAGLAEGGGRARTVLQRLRAAGVRIALDDFGTGVSSLTGLRRLPVDILKIERAAWAADTRTSGRPVLTALVGLAHACGLQAVVEGVESQADREATLAAGTDLAQGFAYYRPAAAAAVDEVLSSPVRKAGGVLTPAVPVPGHSL